jgi:hypothetical protein
VEKGERSQVKSSRSKGISQRIRNLCEENTIKKKEMNTFSRENES